MQRKIVLLTFVFSTLTFWNGYSAESGGMPQLNPEFWISQIFWLIISFGILFVILSKFILPKIIHIPTPAPAQAIAARPAPIIFAASSSIFSSYF